MKYRIDKCYLVSIEDDEGNEVDCQYVFCENKELAKQIAKEMLNEANTDYKEVCDLIKIERMVRKWKEKA